MKIILLTGPITTQQSLVLSSVENLSMDSDIKQTHDFKRNLVIECYYKNLFSFNASHTPPPPPKTRFARILRSLASIFQVLPCNPCSEYFLSLINHPCFFMAYYYLWYLSGVFSILVTYYFQFFFQLKGSFVHGQNDLKKPSVSSFHNPLGQPYLSDDQLV